MKLAALIAFLSVTGLVGTAAAQTTGKATPAGGAAGDNVQYKQKTVFDFEDDMVEGDLQRPDGERVDSLRRTQHASLITIRPDFIPEMLKSLEDL